MHINCLKLLAATLAIKCFARDKTNIMILLKVDNITAISYINRLGWHSIPSTEPTDQGPMALVHGQEHYTEGCPSSRETERHSERRVGCDERQIRLDVMPNNIPKDQRDDGTNGSGPLRIQTYSQTFTICELTTRPRGNDM